MKRSFAVFISRVDICARFGKNRDDFGFSFICRPVKQSFAVFISRIDIRARLDKNRDNFGLSQ